MRIAYFDTLKGAMILFIILGHCLWYWVGMPFVKSLYAVIYLFHIPIFVALSGYFFKNKRKFYLANLAYYALFQALYVIFFTTVLKAELGNPLVEPVWLMWYLLSLVTWGVMTALIGKVTLKKIGLFLLLVGVAGFFDEIGEAFSLSRTIYFFPFFLAGVYIRQNNLSLREILCPYAKRIVIATGLCLILFIEWVVMGDFDLRWLHGAEGYQEGTETIFIRYIIYALRVLVSVAVVLLITKLSFAALQWCGRKSRWIYLLHGFIVKLLF